MTIDQIRPCKLATYRRRSDGAEAQVVIYRPGFSTAGFVLLRISDGREWSGTPGVFWLDWCHESIYEPRAVIMRREYDPARN